MLRTRPKRANRGKGASRSGRKPSKGAGSRVQGWQLAHKVGRNVAFVVVPILLLAAVATLIVQVRLRHGPVSLQVFVPMIERGIGAGMEGFTAQIGDLEAFMTDEGRIEFRLVDVTINEKDGNPVASAPLASVDLSRAAMWSLRAVPERVNLIEPQVSLFYSRDEGMSLSFSNVTNAKARDAPSGNDKGSPSRERQGTASQPLRNAPLKGQFQAPAGTAVSPPRRIGLARLLARSSARARRGSGATSYLREFGLRNAKVVLDYEGKLTSWQVPEVAIDLQHMSKRSVISGRARIAQERGTWLLTFRAEDSEKAQSLNVKASVRDLIPSALGQSLPHLGLLQTLELPVAADASLQLATSGVLNHATLAVELGKGRVNVSTIPQHPILVDAGLLQFDYDAAKRLLTMSPSTIKWGDSWITLLGTMKGKRAGNQNYDWNWSLKAKEGALASEEFGVAPIPIEDWTAEGKFSPHQGQATLNFFLLKAGATEVGLTGQMTTIAGQQSLKIDGVSSPMDIATLKVLWPRAAAPAMRSWFGTHVTKGRLGAGKLKYASGLYVEPNPDGTALNRNQITASFEANGLEVDGGKDLPPLSLPRAGVRVENGLAEISVPELLLTTPSGKRVTVKGTKFTATGLGTATATGIVSVNSKLPLNPLLEIYLSGQPGGMSTAPPEIAAINGDVNANVTARIPLSGPIHAESATIDGKIEVSNLSAKPLTGKIELQGGTIDIVAGKAGFAGAGDLLLNGVIVKLKFKHDLNLEPHAQEPIHITATLDNSDRNQLGFDVNHLVQGDVKLDVAVTRNYAGEPKIKVEGDLTNAELALRDIAWKKPRGVATSLKFDVAKSTTQNIELQNFKISGENVAIEGWLSIDQENDVREFYFPEFSLNVVSRLEVEGALSDKKIWRVKAKGATFDGRDFFKHLSSLGAPDKDRIKPLRPSKGVNVEARIGTVIGHGEVSLRNFKLELSERSDKIVGLDASGKLDGGSDLSVLVRHRRGQARTMSAVTKSAGQAFKLVGFYNSMVGGTAQLDVNLDGKGAADKTGYLWIDNFKVLGDPIVSEVVSNAPGESPKSKRKVVRQEIDFTKLFARFSAGHAQLVLEDAAVKGPLLGATIRGKIDYGVKRLNLGGTYVPLQGINAAFCDIPVVGQIITGTSCEGLLGITYAIQGPISKPQVIVNPFSMVAPGIFREIFTMTNPNPRVLPRSDSKPDVPLKKRLGTSASPVVRGKESEKKSSSGNSSGIDGWTLETGGQN